MNADCFSRREQFSHSISVIINSPSISRVLIENRESRLSVLLPPAQKPRRVPLPPPPAQEPSEGGPGGRDHATWCRFRPVSSKPTVWVCCWCRDPNLLVCLHRRVHVLGLRTVRERLCGRRRRAIGDPIPESAKMNFRNRKLLQTLSCAVLIAYTTLLIYQTLSRGGALGGQEVGDDFIRVRYFFLKKRHVILTIGIPNVSLARQSQILL